MCIAHVCTVCVDLHHVCTVCVCVRMGLVCALCVCIHALWESVCTVSVCICKRTWDWQKLVSGLLHPWVCLGSNEDLLKSLGEGPYWAAPYVLPQ